MKTEKSDNQTVDGTEQDNIVVDHPTELLDSNNNRRSIREQKPLPENEEDPVIKEELMNATPGATNKCKKPTSSKKELKKRIKKLKLKGLIPRKKENTGSEIRKERSYSEDNLNYSSTTDCKIKNYEEHSPLGRFRSRMGMTSSKGRIPEKKENTGSEIRKERSYSEDNLNYSSTTDRKIKNYEEHSSLDRFRSRMGMTSSKGRIPGKKENTGSEIRKERSYSEDNLNYSSTTDCKIKNYEEHSPLGRFRSRMGMTSSISSPKFVSERRKRSKSENNLDYFSKFEVEKTSRDECSSLEDLGSELECSSTDSNSTTYKYSSDTHVYSDNDLNLPRRVSMDGNLTRDRSFSCAREGNPLQEDIKPKKERQKLVKRDSWFLTRKQKMKDEWEKNSNPKERRIGSNDKEEGTDSGRQLRNRGEVNQTKSSVEEGLKSGLMFENQNKDSKQKLERKPSSEMDERSKPNDEQNKKMESGVNAKNPLKISLRKRQSDEINEDSTSGSELDHRSKNSKPRERKKTDVPSSKDKKTLLTISASRSGSEREEDSGLSTGTSIDTVNGLRNDGSTWNIVENDSEGKNTIPEAKSKQVSSQVEECGAITKAKNVSNSKELLVGNQAQKTAPVYVEINPPLPENNERPEVTKDPQCNEKTKPSESVQGSMTNRTTGSQEHLEIVRKNEKHTKNKTNQIRNDSVNGESQNTGEAELLVDKKFQNDLRFIDRETKRSLRSGEYLERARKRYHPKPYNCLETNLACIVMGAVSKNPAAGILLPFSN